MKKNCMFCTLVLSHNHSISALLRRVSVKAGDGGEAKKMGKKLFDRSKNGRKG